MRGSHYTPEQNAFIIDNYPDYGYKALTERYNQEFSASINVETMRKKCRALGLPKKEIAYQSRFTDEANLFMRQNAYQYTSAKLAALMQEKFGISVAVQTVTDQLNRLGIHRGNCYKPEGYISASSKPIGSERIEKGRQVMVKIAQPNVWVPKASVVMGYDPKEYQAIFLDGNSLNVTPENILVVSKRVHARLAKEGWLKSSKEIIQTGILWSELLYQIQKITKER